MMNNNDTRRPTPTEKPRPISSRVTELDDGMDERDETLRLLNEALSEALTELESSAPIAA